MSSVVIAGDVSGTVTLDAPAVAGTTVLTLPATSGAVVTDTATQTLTNKTLTSPTLTSPNLGTPSTLVGTNITGTANALNAGIGVNQTWQNLTASRAANVAYFNTTGKPILVNVKYEGSAPTLVLLYVNGIDVSWSQVGGERGTVTAIVPNGGSYSIGYIFSAASALAWYELR
jgi:hypothetical protein